MSRGCLYTATLFVDGDGVYGDLHVSGFATISTAREVGDGFKKVLADRYPGATVGISIKREDTYLTEGTT